MACVTPHSSLRYVGVLGLVQKVIFLTILFFSTDILPLNYRWGILYLTSTFLPSCCTLIWQVEKSEWPSTGKEEGIWFELLCDHNGLLHYALIH